jgi:hypothetical protein
MTRSLGGKLASIALLVVFPVVTLNAAPPAAVMYASGNVLVNGVGAPSSTAIFEGDRLRTGTNSAVDIVLDGALLTLAPESSLRLQGGSVSLETGSISVATTKRLGAQAGAISVFPVADTKTSYRVARLNNAVFVSTTAGTVKVIDNGVETLVAEAMTMSFADDQDQPGQDQDHNNTKKRNGTPPPAARVGNGVAVLLVAATAGAAAAITYLTTRSSSISPSAP